LSFNLMIYWGARPRCWNKANKAIKQYKKSKKMMMKKIGMGLSKMTQ